MGQWVKPDGTRVVDGFWFLRLNAQSWLEIDGRKIPIPFTCEFCHKDKGCYGDEDGIYCTSCWVAKKTP